MHRMAPKRSRASRPIFRIQKISDAVGSQHQARRPTKPHSSPHSGEREVGPQRGQRAGAHLRWPAGSPCPAAGPSRRAFMACCGCQAPAGFSAGLTKARIRLLLVVAQAVLPQRHQRPAAPATTMPPQVRRLSRAVSMTVRKIRVMHQAVSRSGWAAISSTGPAARATGTSRCSQGALLHAGRVLDVLGQRQDQQHLHQLGRLHGQRPDVEPALGPAGRAAADQHPGQHAARRRRRAT